MAGIQFRRFETTHILFIDELYLVKKYRNHGIGTAFVNHLARKKKKAKALCLEVMPDNKKALKFYKKLQFKIDKRSHLILALD